MSSRIYVCYCSENHIHAGIENGNECDFFNSMHKMENLEKIDSLIEVLFDSCEDLCFDNITKSIKEAFEKLTDIKHSKLYKVKTTFGEVELYIGDNFPDRMENLADIVRSFYTVTKFSGACDIKK